MSQKTQWLVGPHAVAGGLANDPTSISELLVVTGKPNHRLRDLIAEAEQAGVAVRHVPAKELERVVGNHHHQGIAAAWQGLEGLSEAAFFQQLDAALAAGEAPLILGLDEVQDPRNLGACLRSAEAAGVMAVLTPKHRAASLTPAARKAAAGGAEVVPVVQVGNLARCMKALAERGVWMTGLAGEGAQLLYKLDLTGPTLLMAGNEEKGLRRLTRENCDQLAYLPMAGQVSSLNVSVATGIALFEAVRQRTGQ
jgi:23S rRNA (guanosine2251-2'-O)-methyltransferase